MKQTRNSACKIRSKLASKEPGASLFPPRAPSERDARLERALAEARDRQTDPNHRHARILDQGVRKGVAPLHERDSAERKAAPVYSGVIRYFPRALVAVAALSKRGNDKHNPGEPMHWARDKSTDHRDCIARHLVEAGGVDSEGTLHSVALAWRALAALELELEALEAEGGT